MKNGKAHTNGHLVAKTVVELRDDLLKSYSELRRHPLKPEEQEAVTCRTRVAGMILKSAAQELKYRQARKEYPVIPFLGEAAKA